MHPTNMGIESSKSRGPVGDLKHNQKLDPYQVHLCVIFYLMGEGGTPSNSSRNRCNIVKALHHAVVGNGHGRIGGEKGTRDVSC